MKNYIYILFGLMLFQFSHAQGFQDGEFLQYRVHYGFLNAGFATLKLNETTLNGKKQYHVVGEGSSSGAVRVFFKVDDRYESYFEKGSYKPTRFIRKISEGGHRKDRELNFDHNRNVVSINDKLGKKMDYVKFGDNVHDMLSAFYYLRSKSNHDFRTGEFYKINVFMDGETYPFKLKVEGRERLKTKFGYINSIRLKPYVQSGRVFEAEESVTMWVSDDANLVPLKIKANLAVGSLEMDLHKYRKVKDKLDFR